MNSEQAKTIFDRIFVAFPMFREWLAKVESPKDTYADWCRMLAKVSWYHGEQVCELLVTGERKMPAAYERDQLPVFIKSYADRLVQDERSAAAEGRKRSAVDEYRSGRQRSADARSGRDELYEMKMSTAYRKLLEIGQQFQDGQIDEETRKERADEIIKIASTKRGG